MADRVTRVHNQQFVQELAVKYRKPGTIGDKVCPRVRVKKQADKYRIWGKDRFVNRGANAARWAPGTEPNEITMRWSEDNYFSELYKLRTKLTDAERDNADNDLDLDGNAAEYVAEGLEVAKEARIASLFTNAGNYAASHKIAKAGGSEYDQAAVISTDQILKDIDAIVSAIKLDAVCTSRDLTVVIPDPVFDKAVKRCAGILDKIKYVQKGVVTPELLAELLDVKEVVIALSIATSPALEAEGSDVVSGYTTANLWGENIWVGLVAPDGGSNDMQPSFARNFSWTAGTGGQDKQSRVYRDADEGKECDWVEEKEAAGEKVQFKDAGGLITNCLA